MEESMSQSESYYRNSERRGELMIPAPTVPKSFNQFGGLILDGSGSMNEEALNGMCKADVVNVVTGEFFALIKNSSLRSNLSFGVATFAETARVLMEPTAAADINDNTSFDPRHRDGKGTFIGSGLLLGKYLAEEFLAGAKGGIPTSAVLVVLSDGRDKEGSGQGPDETLRIAEEIKRNPAITICAAYFAQKGRSDAEAEDVLRRIASNPASGYRTVTDAGTLRSFFQASLSAGCRI
jgi:hypothetical protein